MKRKVFCVMVALVMIFSCINCLAVSSPEDEFVVQVSQPTSRITYQIPFTGRYRDTFYCVAAEVETTDASYWKFVKVGVYQVENTTKLTVRMDVTQYGMSYDNYDVLGQCYDSFSAYNAKAATLYVGA